jgi:subtilisin family serine protease
MSTQQQSSGSSVRFVKYLALFALLALVGALGIQSLAAQEDNSSTSQLSIKLEDISTEIDPADLDTRSLSRRARNPYPNLSNDLYDLYETHQNGQPVTSSDDDLPGAPQVEDGRVKVMLIMLDEASADAALQQLPGMGGTVTAHYKQWIDAWLPIDQLDDAAQFSGISLVRTPIERMPVDPELEPDRADVQAGANLTQGVVASNAIAWHTSGVDGQGIRVAVLDSFEDYQAAQESGDLPATINTYGTLNLNSPHGTACAEIIYDMAPGVELTLASPATTTEMAQYIEQLAQDGHDIISSSIGFLAAAPGDGTDPIAQAIDTAENTYGTLYVQAAGNSAEYHWDGVFTNDGNGYQQFGTGNINLLNYNPADDLVYAIPQNYPLLITLTWNDWYQSDQDYDLLLYQQLPGSDQWTLAAKSDELQTGTQPPVEFIFTPAPETAFYGVVIENFSASGSEVLNLSGGNVPDFVFQVPERSVTIESGAESTFAVAALDVTDPYTRESYSSVGPTYGPGGALTGGRDQPRIAGYANVDTFAYGAGIFNGTSSATPHVAGAAALVRQNNPSFTPDDVKTFLEGRAIDLGDPGYEHWHGAGRLYLGTPAIVNFTPRAYIPVVVK